MCEPQYYDGSSNVTVDEKLAWYYEDESGARQGPLLMHLILDLHASGGVHGDWMAWPYLMGKNPREKDKRAQGGLEKLVEVLHQSNVSISSAAVECKGKRRRANTGLQRNQSGVL